MMKKQMIIVGITLVLIIVGLTGCFGNNGNNGNDGNLDNRFIGEWKAAEDGDQQPLMIVKTNGSLYFSSGTITMYIGTWKIKGNQICVTAEGQSEDCQRFEFTNNNKTLTVFFDENNPSVYIKQ